jgi:ABC-2 type transport system permease protein
MTDRVDPGWRVLAEREFRDLWVSGRGPWLVFAFSVLLSAITYLAATNQVLDYLARRDVVDLVLRIVVAVGVLVTLVVSADGISGERERGTLESLLLAPVSARQIVTGKLLAALSRWFAAFLVGGPYVWLLGRSASIVVPAVFLGLVIGTLLAFALAMLGLLISGAADSNKLSLSVSLFVLLALFALTQLPAGPKQSWVADVLIRINPVGSGLHYVSGLLVNETA